MELPVRAASGGDDMRLYAAGFNAWNQLVFEPSQAGEEPDDLFSFVKVMGGSCFSRIVPEMCYTAVQRDNTWSIAGSSPERLLYKGDGKSCLFDSPSAISGNGKVLTAQGPDPLHQSQAILEYPSLTAWKADKSTNNWPCNSSVRQIAAYDAGFVILLEDGSVLSCGDPRFRDCLGREVDEFHPAHIPSLVADLSDLGEPVKKIAAGGYSAAALTESGGLYLWGMQAPGSQSRHSIFTNLSAIPNYVEVDGDKDVQDIAVGESHAIALTTDGCVYVVGDNTNGQAGLGRNAKDPLESWLKLDMKTPVDWGAVAVEAGPRSSFIVTGKAHSE
ncbi:hypothetical protein F66182_4055 [Fusarium sp. NRRL 66182]|nr:hypothetical protein F66182_4055 [Fusarium sp. NRRL 66182]